MSLSARSILLIVAIVLFLLAALTNSNRFDLMLFGLAAFAGAFLADGLGWGTRTIR